MISVIIPIYNSASYLQQCLDSVVNQTFHDLEIICINDGSTDNSLKILEEYKKTDPRVVIINRENRGISYSRNEGIDKATGKWIMFIDSDDWMDLNTCKRVYEIAERDKCDIVMWAYSREFKSKSLPKYYIDKKKEWDGKNVKIIHRRIFGPIGEELSHPDTLDAFGTIWGKLYRKDCMKGIRFVDTKEVGSCEDILFNAEYFTQINKVIYIPECLYYYRKSDSSFTSTNKKNLPDKWENLYKRLSAIINKYDLQLSFKEGLNNRISLGLIGLGLNEMFANNTLVCKYKRINYLLEREIFRESIKDLKLKNFPSYWYLFFFSAKYKQTISVMLMLFVIKKIIER